MKVILYSRVSTTEQAEHGLGLAIQDKAMRLWAKQHGHKIVAAYEDGAVSGVKGYDSSNGLTTRPGLAAAFTDLEDGRADALVVYRLDRLSRKLGHQEVWIERMLSIGRQVISVTEPGYGDDEMRTLVRQILGSVAEYERVVIVKRMQNGRAAKAARGGYAYGSPPFGWRAERGALVPVESEQVALRAAHALRARGGSLREIASALEAEGYRPRRGGKWHPGMVSRLLAHKPAA